MLHEHRQIRQRAAQMLLVWLFALAAGIVNACTLGSELRQDTESGGHEQHAASSSVPSSSARADAHSDHSPDSDKAPCANFCDEPAAGAQSVRIFLQQTEPFTAVWLAALPQKPPTVATPPRVRHMLAAELEWWRPAIPISIAFLRLTL